MDVGAPGAADRIALILIRRKLAGTFSRTSLLQIGEAESQNIQNGGASLSSATTSLASKAVSSLLGVAEESGAISSSNSSSATTLTANIAQFANYLESPVHRCYVISDQCSFGNTLVRGATVSVSLNTSKSTTPSNTRLSAAAISALAGTQNPTFGGFTVQENFRGRKSQVTQDKFVKALDSVADAQKSNLVAAFVTFHEALIGSSAYNASLAACVPTLRDAVGEDLTARLDACVEAFATAAQVIPGIDATLTKLTQAEIAYDLARDKALQLLFYRTTLSVEYDFTNQLNQPTQSGIKGIFGYQSKSGAFQTTANAGVTLYNDLEGSAESRVRSAQFASQLDYKPTTKPKLQASYSAGYYFQYMVSNGLVTLPSTSFAPGTTVPLPGNASTLLNTTGPIHIGQGKITLSIKGTNISIPLAISGASRTDLIKANKVSGNFGISYDFSSLLATKP